MAQVALLNLRLRLTRGRLRHHREMLHRVAGRFAMTLDTVARARRGVTKLCDGPLRHRVAGRAVGAEPTEVTIRALVARGACQHGRRNALLQLRPVDSGEIQQRIVVHACRHACAAAVLSVAAAAGRGIGMKRRAVSGQQRRFVVVAGAAGVDADRPQGLMALRAVRGDRGVSARQWSRVDQRMQRPAQRGQPAGAAKGQRQHGGNCCCHDDPARRLPADRAPRHGHHRPACAQALQMCSPSVA